MKTIVKLIVLLFITDASAMNCTNTKSVEFKCLNMNASFVPDQDTSANRQHMGAHFSMVRTLPVEETSPEERAGLILLREEEKLARDVYNNFGTLYTLPAFRNIPASEQQHMDEVKFLLDRYKIEDPAAGKTQGEFRSSVFRNMYLKLTSGGSESLVEALKAAALIEETDIRDLKYELENHVDNQDIKYIFNNLIRGSENHLRAFTSILKKNGINYTPVILDNNYFNQIASGRSGQQ